MPVGEVVIELGDDWDAPPPAARPALSPHLPRAACAALLAAGTLFGITASTQPQPPSLTEIAVLPDRARQVQIAGAALITSSDARLTVYDLADGEMRWSVPSDGISSMPLVTSRWVIWQASGFLGTSVNVTPGESWTFLSTPEMRVYDLVTGEQRMAAAMVVSRRGDRTLMFEPVVSAAPIEFHDHDTLELRWMLARPYAFQIDTERQAVYTATKDGRYFEYDLVTGAVRRSGRLSTPPTGERCELNVRDGEFQLVETPMSNRISEEGTSEIWFERATLEVLAAPTWEQQPDICGEQWCVRVDSSDRSVLDKETGAVWDLPDGRYLLGSAAGLLMTAHRDGEIGAQVIGVVDRRTGRVLRQLGGWSVAVEPGTQARVLLRPARVGDHVHVGVLTPDGVRVLGDLPFAPTSCAVRNDVLACADSRGLIHLVRLRG
jgi:hypothetical protein